MRNVTSVLAGILLASFATIVMGLDWVRNSFELAVSLPLAINSMTLGAADAAVWLFVPAAGCLLGGLITGLLTTAKWRVEARWLVGPIAWLLVAVWWLGYVLGWQFNQYAMLWLELSFLGALTGGLAGGLLANKLAELDLATLAGLRLKAKPLSE